MQQKDTVNIKCPKCKTIVSSDDFFCKSCGYKLKSKDNIVNVDSKKVLSNRLVLIFSFLLLSLVAVIFILNKNPKTNTNNLQTDANNEQVPSSQLINQQKISELKAIVERNPKDLDNLISLANLLHDSDLPAEAIIYYKKYLELNNKNADARVDMAICYFNLGDNETAKKEISEAIKISPQHQKAYFNLGVIYLNEGNVKESNNYFQKCFDINPLSPTGIQAKEILEQHKNIKLNK